MTVAHGPQILGWRCNARARSTSPILAIPQPSDHHQRFSIHRSGSRLTSDRRFSLHQSRYSSQHHLNLERACINFWIFGILDVAASVSAHRIGRGGGIRLRPGRGFSYSKSPFSSSTPVTGPPFNPRSLPASVDRARLITAPSRQPFRSTGSRSRFVTTPLVRVLPVLLLPSRGLNAGTPRRHSRRPWPSPSDWIVTLHTL